MISYRIEPSPFERDRWILLSRYALFGGTWLECAKRLRELHPKAKLMVCR